MIVWWVERRAARAARWEMDLSGGTYKVPWRVRAGSMRVLGVMAFEVVDLLFCQLSDVAFGEVSERDGSYAEPLEGEELQPHRPARPAYYAVTALVQGEVEGCLARGAGMKVGELRGTH